MSFLKAVTFVFVLGLARLAHSAAPDGLMAGAPPGYIGRFGDGSFATDWPVSGAAFSADGQSVLLLNNAVTTWNTDNGSYLGTLEKVSGNALSAVGQAEIAILSTWGEEATVRRYDLKEKREVWQLRLPQNVNYRNAQLSGSRDGRWIAVAGERIELIDLKDDSVRELGDAQPNEFRRLMPSELTFSGDGRWLHWNSGNSQNWVLDLSDPKAQPHSYSSGGLISCTLTAGGKYLVGTGKRLTLIDRASDRIIDTTTEDAQSLHHDIKMPRTSEVYRHIVAAPVGTRVASIFLNRLAIWDTAGGKLKLEREWDLHDWYFNSLVWSPDAKRLLTIGQRGVIELWDVGQGKCLVSSSESIQFPEELDASADGKYLAEIGTGRVVLWSAETRQKVSGWALPDSGKEFPENIKTGRFTPEGLWLIPMRLGPILFDPKTGMPLKRVPRENAKADLFAADMSEDGRTYAYATLDGHTLVSRNGIAKSFEHDKSDEDVGYFLRLMPDAPGFLMVTNDLLGAWDFEHRRQTPPLDLHIRPHFAYSVSLSQDGRWFANPFSNELFDLTRCPDLAAARSLRPLQSMPTFSPRGGMYLSTRPQLEIVETATGSTIASATANEDEIHGVFIPGSSRFAITGRDGVPYLWDVAGMSLGGGFAAADVSDDELWSRTAADDAAAAYAAILTLQQRGRLAERVKRWATDPSSIGMPPGSEVHTLIEALNSPDHAASEKAQLALERIGRGIVPVIVQHLWIEPPGERRERLQSLSRLFLEQWCQWADSPAARRRARCAEVLSWQADLPSQEALAALDHALPSEP